VEIRILKNIIVFRIKFLYLFIKKKSIVMEIYKLDKVMLYFE